MTVIISGPKWSRAAYSTYSGAGTAEKAMVTRNTKPTSQNPRRYARPAADRPARGPPATDWRARDRPATDWPSSREMTPEVPAEISRRRLARGVGAGISDSFVEVTSPGTTPAAAQIIDLRQ